MLETNNLRKGPRPKVRPEELKLELNTNVARKIHKKTMQRTAITDLSFDNGI